MQLDVRSVLPLIRVPSLVLHCRGDNLYPIDQGRYVAEMIPGGRFIELSGTDHFAYAENGDAVADEIEKFITGRPSVRNNQRRLATPLMTDVAGSTERASQMGDARWRALLDAHDRVLADQINRYRGRLVDTAGDGCLALFEGPRDALLAANSIDSEVARLGLAIRAGIHVGEIEQRADRVAGIAVHIAARVCALAGGGETLVTRTVRDLVAGSEIPFTDRGTYVLKGIEDEWRLYAVQAA